MYYNKRRTGVAEVLSQDEINALLNNISSEKPVQEEKEGGQGCDHIICMISSILTGFPRISSGTCGLFMKVFHACWRLISRPCSGTIVDVHLLSIDQVTFLEFTMAMSNPGCIWIFSTTEYEGRGIVEVSPDLVLLTIERLFGGEGKQLGEMRSLSIIEQNVASKIIQKDFIHI
jgi:flagellar motor switch protein FliM